MRIYMNRPGFKKNQIKKENRWILRYKWTDSIDVSVAKWLVNFKFIVNATEREQLTALEKARSVVTTDTVPLEK